MFQKCLYLVLQSETAVCPSVPFMNSNILRKAWPVAWKSFCPTKRKLTVEVASCLRQLQEVEGFVYGMTDKPCFL